MIYVLIAPLLIGLETLPWAGNRHLRAGQGELPEEMVFVLRFSVVGA